jgi:hypothetical protein
MKKILSMILAVAMSLTMFIVPVGAVDYVDVTANDAVDLLSDLGIITGYEDETFRPDNTLTRAEAATIMVRMLGLDDEVVKGNTVFTDVPASHWASGYINVAVANGIVNGLGDGTYNPEGLVTYEQVVKMIVCALGYEPVATSNGGWENGGYLVAGSKAGFTKGVAVSAKTAPVNRKIVAELIYNALEVELMDQESWSDGLYGNEFKVQKGHTILTDYLEVDKIEGIVVNTYLNDETINFEDKTVDIDAYNVNGIKDENSYYGYNVGDTDAAALLGYNVIAYVGENEDGEDTVFAIAPKDGKNTIIVIDGELCDGFNEDGELVYWKSETAKKESVIKADNYYFYENGIETFSFNEDCDEYIVLDNGRDEVYIFVTTIEDGLEFVVSEIDKEDNAWYFESENGDDFVIDYEDEDVLYKIMKNGKLIDASDIEEDDVITIYDKEASIITVYVSSNTIIGTVDEVDNDIYVVNDTEYKVSSFTDLIFNAGDKGTFYLNAFGKIAYADTKESYNASNYVYVIDTYKDTTGTFGNVDYLVKAMTISGDVVVYELKNTKLTLNGEKNINVETVFADIEAETVVRVKTSGDKITSIWTSGLVTEDGTDEYKSNRNTLGPVDTNKNMIIFAIEDGDDDLEDRITVTTVGNLFEHEEEYTYVAYGMEDEEYDVLVVTGATSTIDKEAPIMVITKISNVAIDDDPTVKVTGICAGKKVSVTVDPDADVEELTVGDAITYATTNGYMTSVEVFASIDFETYSDEYTSSYDEDTEITYYAGYIEDKTSNAIILEDETKIYLDDCNVIVVDYTAREITAKVGSTTDLKKSSKYNKFVLVKTIAEEEDTAADVIVFITEAE